MRLKLFIDCDNEAFGDLPGAEAARILRRVADSIEENCAEELACAEDSLRDVNGNRVGKFYVED